MLIVLARKSQVAIEYANRLIVRDADSSAFWVHASSLAQFYESYHDICVTADIPGQDDAKADVLRLVARWLASDKAGSWLLILDNVDKISVMTSP
jgi:hypothetical protein